MLCSTSLHLVFVKNLYHKYAYYFSHSEWPTRAVGNPPDYQKWPGKWPGKQGKLQCESCFISKLLKRLTVSNVSKMNKRFVHFHLVFHTIAHYLLHLALREFLVWSARKCPSLEFIFKFQNIQLDRSMVFYFIEYGLTFWKGKCNM